VTATSLAADVRFKKLTIPGLEPGDCLSYRMIQRQKPLAPGRVFGEIKLAVIPGSPPQTYELDIPRDAGVRVHLRKGIDAKWEEIPSAPDRYVRRLLLQPPSANAAGQATLDLEGLVDPDVIFTSFESWNEVARWWWGISRDRLLPDAAVRAQAGTLSVSAKTPRERVAALLAFTSVRVRYLNVSFGLGRMQPRKAPDVLANRYGDCKDKHALLAALASSLGIDVRPVLINSTRNNLHDDAPSPQQFDHMISVVRFGGTPEEWLWLDSTNPFAPPGHLLANLRDKPALLVEANGDATLVRTPGQPPFVPSQEITLKAALSPNGVLKGRVAWQFRSDEEVQLRSLFAMVPQDRRAEMIQAGLAREWTGGKVDNVSLSDPLDVGSPLRVEFDAEMTIEAKGTERKLPVPAPSFNLPEPDGEPFPSGPAARFGVREFVLRAEIELPEGQQAQLPLSLSLDRPFGTFRSSYSVDGRTLKLERTLRLSEPEIAGADVPSYEAFRSAISKDHDQAFTVTGVEAVAAAPSAAGLHKEGKAAFDRKEFKKAVELFRQATELDPKLSDGFLDLGRAYCDLHDYEQALQSFSRQIEVAPFHESAYGWRGYVYGRLDRWFDAERDLRKQIEVAPFNEWPYEELARRQSRLGKHDEAVDLYSRAAQLQPKAPDRWLDLAQEQQLVGRAQDARLSLEKATGLKLQDWRTIRAAKIYSALGDLETAGRLAREAVPSVASRLAKMEPSDLDAGDSYWSGQLADAWHLVGQAAAAAGDTAKAEQYLTAAWQLSFKPESAWVLGELREKQGRLADAVELWSMAAAIVSPIGSALPADYQRRIEGACAKLPEVDRPGQPPAPPGPKNPSSIDVFGEPARQSQARVRLTELRTVRLTGPFVANVAENVVLLAGADGRVERVLDVSRKSPDDFERQLASLKPIRMEVPRPDENVYKAVRRGLFSCSAVSGCALVLDVPEPPAPKVGAKGWIEITSMEPKEGSTVKPGARVTLVAKIRYRVSVANASVRLLVFPPPTDMGRAAQFRPLAETKLHSLSGSEGDLTLTTTFTAPAEPGRVRVIVFAIAPDVATQGSWLDVR
jgi:tetratricopeptide (TPR) repeat protein/transglutaminase-like putative cysteine protease